MPILCGVLKLVVFALLLVAAPNVSGKALEDRNWIEVKTPNFKIRSTLSRKKTIELIHNLELFRVAVGVVTNIRATNAPIPTEIYAIKKKKNFTKFGLDGTIAGVFMPALRNNTILIRDAPGMAETSTIMHEYVHFMQRNHSAFHYPKWYDEGLAEYLGASAVKGEFLELGIIPKHRIDSLNYARWIPIHKILTAEGYDDWSVADQAMFYAEAWALVHYLLNRANAESPFSQLLGRYLQLVEAGGDDLESFETAFGIKPSELNTEVKRYIRGRLTAYRVRTDALLPEFTPEIKKLSREEASLGLAQLAFRRGQLEMAERWFTIASDSDITRPYAEAGLGKVLQSQGEFDRAQIHFDSALVRAPEDTLIHLDIAEFWHDRARMHTGLDVDIDYLDLARGHYVKAWKLDDTNPEIYAMYGQTFLINGENFATAIEMLEKANELLPSNLDVRIRLAQAYAGADRRQDAIDEARAVLAWSHTNSAAARLAKDLIVQMDSEQ